MADAKHVDAQKVREGCLAELKDGLLANGWEDSDRLHGAISLIDIEAEHFAGQLRKGVVDPSLTDPGALHDHLIGNDPDSYVLGLFGPHVASLALRYFQAGLPEQQ